jgi:hypothetical protein
LYDEKNKKEIRFVDLINKKDAVAIEGGGKECL